MSAAFFSVICARRGRRFLGEYRGRWRWTREGEQAATRLASPFFPECHCSRGFYVPYESPVERSREYYQAAIRAAAWPRARFRATSWGLLGELYYLDLWQGRPLGQVAAKKQAQRDLMARAGDALGQHAFALVASYAAFLRVPRERPGPPRAGMADRKLPHFLAVGNGFVAELARIQEAHLFLAFGEHARALERAEEAERFRPPSTDLHP